jgi:hypothetical protein
MCGVTTSKQVMAAIILSVAVGAVSFPGAASGQLPSASTATLATANNYTALARGFTAIASNPAGLGMPGNPGFSLALLPVQARVGLNAVSLAEIDAFAGQALPTATKEAWLNSVIAEGGLAARAGAAATAFALSVGPVGLQISTVGQASASLGPDAFELALFGNAGRTGTTRDMTMTGTGSDGWGATTAALALGIPLPETKGGSLAAGATLKYTMGHAVVATRDDGSMITANPIGIDLALPSILPDSFNVNNGTGIGLDVGVAWEGSTWAISAAVQNVFHTFQWNLDAFAFRPGEVLADNASVTTDFDPLPVASAPATLQSEVLAQGFEPVLNLGVAYRATERIAVTADFRHDSGEALVTAEGSHIGMGVEFRVIPFLPLRGGVSRVSGGAIHFAGGFGLEMGPVHLSGGYLVEKNSAGEFKAASVALSFAHN